MFFLSKLLQPPQITVYGWVFIIGVFLSLLSSVLFIILLFYPKSKLLGAALLVCVILAEECFYTCFWG